MPWFKSDAVRKLKSQGMADEFAEAIHKAKELQRRRMDSVFNDFDMNRPEFVSSESYIVGDCEIKIKTTAKVSVQD